MSDLPLPPRRSGAHTFDSVRSPLVLLVEDDVVQAEMYRIALTANNRFDVIHVADGYSALEQINLRSSIACVVSDINLGSPEDGFDVLRASKLLRPHTPVLLMTALSDKSVPSEAIRGHADDLLLKPIDLKELVARVGVLIDAARERNAAASRTVLAIGAHPDDVEIGIGGTLLVHAANGDRVIHLMMTDGESGGDKDIRVAEAERAADMMGAELVRGRLPDGFLSDTRDVVKVVARTIAEYNPSIIYCHSMHDGHQDHRATYHATASGARGIPTFCCYQSPSTTVDFRPSRYIDIGDYLDHKIALINMYRSQTSTRLYLTEDLIRATARYWGRFAAHRVVEPLEVTWQLAP